MKKKAFTPEQIVGKPREVKLLSKWHMIGELSTHGFGQESVDEESANMVSKQPCHLLMVQIQWSSSAGESHPDAR